MLIKNEHKYTSCLHYLIMSLIICYIGIYTQKKSLIRGKINSFEGVCGKNVSILITTCWQLLKLHFLCQKYVMTQHETKVVLGIQF